MLELKQTWHMPEKPLPIVIFGAGSIVRDAHIPSYQASGFKIDGVFDPDTKKSEQLSRDFNVPILRTLEDALKNKNVVFDLATPPASHSEILSKLPNQSGVLIQKPLGSCLSEATNIVSICKEKSLRAAVNFQLRFAPMMIAIKDAIDKGLLGDVVDFDAWLALDTPWELWKFLEGLPRVEILLHSIHYFDFVRSILGDPNGIKATTLGHPNSSTSNTRTAAILDYGKNIRCALSINHNHSFGRKFQACEFRICGTKGAAYVHLGVNLNYPRGEPDRLELHIDNEWRNIPLKGSWFTDSFSNRMAQLQRFIAGEEQRLVSSVYDAWNTMALVEAAYEDSERKGQSLAKLSNLINVNSDEDLSIL